MKDGITKVKALMGVELYEISNNFIYHLRNSNHKPQQAFDYLPEFTINLNDTANNRPTIAEAHHQWVGTIEEQKNEKYLYFNLETIDDVLQYEFDQVGVEELFEHIDFKKVLSVFKPEPEENIIRHAIPQPHYLIVEITYITSFGGSGEYDCDTSHNIIGYLNDDLMPVYF